MNSIRPRKCVNLLLTSFNPLGFKYPHHTLMGLGVVHLIPPLSALELDMRQFDYILERWYVLTIHIYDMVLGILP